MYTFLRSLAVASASVGFAAILPGSLRAAVPVPPAEASLVVQNDRGTPVTVYVEQGNLDLRVGTVAAGAITTLRVPWAVAPDQRDVRIFAQPEHGFDVATRRLSLLPDDHIGVLVPPAGEDITAPPAQAAMLDPDPASPATSVTVRNGRGERVEILAQFGQFDTRLGSVAPHATATLRIPGRFVNWRGVVLVADFRDGLDLHTAPLRIAKHHHLGMILPAL